MMDSEHRMAAKEENKREVQEARVSLVRYEGPLGGLTSFNIEHGFCEGLIRGLRSSILKYGEYRLLAQCSSLDEAKLILSDTDYGSVLSTLPSGSKLTPEIIIDRCDQKFVQEFFYIRSQGVGELATFLDLCTYEYQIKAICFVISSLIKGSDLETLLGKVEPLGKSPFLKSVLFFENYDNQDGLLDLYRTVLVDTPVAPYFERFFNAQVSKKSDRPGGREIQNVYNDVDIEIITNYLQKLWLEDFYAYTQELGGTTAEIMKDLLEFEADARAIRITINSFNNPQLNDPAAGREGERQPLYCTFGKLYPEATYGTFKRVGDQQSLAQALGPYPQYRDIFQKAQEQNLTPVDVLYQMEVKLNAQAFDSQSQFAAFFAYTRLKKQEQRNLSWILKMINLKRPEKDKLSHWVKIF